ncbi:MULTISPECIES: hypothetical protein [unclassified Streptomyces]|nr:MULTISPECIES: hypothetical protein [unclassified Streptomyces]
MTDLDESEGHCRCCSKREPKRVPGWLGLLVRAVYEIAVNWPW